MMVSCRRLSRFYVRQICVGTFTNLFRKSTSTSSFFSFDFSFFLRRQLQRNGEFLFQRSLSTVTYLSQQGKALKYRHSPYLLFATLPIKFDGIFIAGRLMKGQGQMRTVGTTTSKDELAAGALGKRRPPR